MRAIKVFNFIASVVGGFVIGWGVTTLVIKLIISLVAR